MDVCTHAVMHGGGEEADGGGGQPHLLCFIQVSLLFDAGHPRLAGGFSCLHFLPAYHRRVGVTDMPYSI